MSKPLTGRSLLMWLGTLPDIDAPVVIQTEDGFTTLRAHGTLGTPDMRLRFRRRLGLLVTSNAPRPGWRESRIMLGPLLRSLGELEADDAR